MTAKAYVRDLMRVFEDGLWPNQGIACIPDESQRHLAIAEVLCRIPEEDYAKLKERAYTFDYFIPDYASLEGLKGLLSRENIAALASATKRIYNGTCRTRISFPLAARLITQLSQTILSTGW